MSRTINNGFKVHYQEYLRHHDEPNRSPYDDGATEDDVGLIKNSYYERRRLRRTAERLRRYA